MEILSLVIASVAITLSVISYFNNKDLSKIIFSFRSIRKRLKDAWKRQEVINESQTQIASKLIDLDKKSIDQSLQIQQLNTQLSFAKNLNKGR